MTGSTAAIYYCRLGGGIYDEPMLSSLLAVDDSLGRVRGRYLENAREASERNDTAASREWGGKFNRFYNGNPGVERKDMLRKAYEAANPHGSLYLLIDRIPKLSYTPAKEARRFYKTLSEGLKTSYFGRCTQTAWQEWNNSPKENRRRISHWQRPKTVLSPRLISKADTCCSTIGDCVPARSISTGR